MCKVVHKVQRGIVDSLAMQVGQPLHPCGLWQYVKLRAFMSIGGAAEGGLKTATLSHMVAPDGGGFTRRGLPNQSIRAFLGLRGSDT